MVTTREELAGVVRRLSRALVALGTSGQLELRHGDQANGVGWELANEAGFGITGVGMGGMHVGRTADSAWLTLASMAGVLEYVSSQRESAPPVMDVVYAVVRGSEVVALYRTEGPAKTEAERVNELFKRGKRATVYPMTVHN